MVPAARAEGPFPAGYRGFDALREQMESARPPRWRACWRRPANHPLRSDALSAEDYRDASTPILLMCIHRAWKIENGFGSWTPKA